MATVTQQKSWKVRLWEGISEHKAVSALTVWVLKFAAISSALLLFAAAIVIGISTTQPNVIPSDSVWMAAASAAMSIGTDSALPGMFYQAIEAWKKSEKKQAYLLFGLVIAMLATAVTSYCVASTPFEGEFAHWLLVSKCTLALLYTMMVAHQAVTHSSAPVNTVNADATKIEQTMAELNKKIEKVVNDISVLQSQIAKPAFSDDQLKEIEQLIEKHKPDDLSIERIQALVTETHSVVQKDFTERLSVLQHTISALNAERATVQSPLNQDETAQEADPCIIERSVKEPLKFQRREADRSSVDKKAFVAQLITEHPDLTTVQIQRLAETRGVKVSVGTISAGRNLLNETAPFEPTDKSSSIQSVETERYESSSIQEHVS